MTDQFTVDGIFHARLTSKRESKSGIFLTIQLTPDDFSPDLAQLRAGSLLKMGWQEMVDVSVQPIEIPSQRGTTLDQAFVEPGAKGARGDSRERPAHPKERFEDMPLVKQCVLRCGDDRFQHYLRSHFATVWGLNDFGAVAPHVIAARVVRTICNVASRADLGTDERGAKEWRTLEDGYRQWLLDQRYPADARR